MRLFYGILDNKILSGIISAVCILSAIILKLQYNYELFIGNVIPVSLIAIGFSFLYSSLIAEVAGERDFIRAFIAPLAIISTVLLIKNVDIKYTIIKPILFFGVNMLFFDKEIRKMLA